MSGTMSEPASTIQNMSPAINRHQQTVGQRVSPSHVAEMSVTKAVTDMIPEVMAHSNSCPRRIEAEKIEWVSIEECDLTDWRLREELQFVRGRDPPIVLVLGLARGYQIWALMSNGDCEELLSCRFGPIRAMKFLPQPEPCFHAKDSDVFASCRPLAAICDSEFAVPGRQFCSLKFYSLRSGDQVHMISFDEPLSAIHCNQRCLVVLFSGKLVVCDRMSFEQQFWIRGCFKSEEIPLCPVSLGVNWLAFADAKLSSVYQSCGGIVPTDAVPAYTTHVMSAAKNLSKTMSAFGETVAASLGAKPVAGRPSKPESGPGVLTVIDVSRFDKSHFDIHSCSEPVKGLIAHFPAHHDEPIAAVKLAPGSALTVTCGQSGQCFHVFLILSHPESSTMSAVHHLYTLFRGSTPAKVQDVAFSLDTRWLAVTTNHGTTHVFPITPYGGHINMRSHGSGKIVNKDSRFYRSAGLDFLEPVTVMAASPPRKPVPDSPTGSGSSMGQTGGAAGSSFSHKGSPLTKETHPSFNSVHPSLAKVAGNPRLPPYPHPIVVYAADKIRQQLFGPIANWTPDLSAKKTGGHGSSAGGRLDDVQKFAACFGRSCGLNTTGRGSEGNSESLFLMSPGGRLTEHMLTVRPMTSSSGQETKISAETPIEMTLEPSAQWTLERTKSNQDLGLALPSSHLFLQASDHCGRLNRRRVNYKMPQSESSLIGKLEPARIRNKRPSSSSELGSSWISQVEILTYAGPARRLWMGPQFTFRTYLDPDSTPTQLVSPSGEPGTNLLLRGGGRGSKKGGENAPGVAKDRRAKQSASKPMPMPRSTVINASNSTHYRSVPVVIEATSGSFDERKTGVTMEVCGSWSDTDYISCDEQEGRLRQSIAEAMKETPRSKLSKKPVDRGPLSSDASACTDEDPGSMEDARDSFSSSPTPDSNLQFPSSLDT